ncbi:SDR family NAD(P)-dependent oxidoreductase [Rugosimonospora africana]|uniref:3-ketoacyl-ACP reductase n=1 Tax=Rugosimonospora africana TaxID=556532 RepID=A0A8J3VWJ9_9ACTN|nr:glucose 1-dehydrogenase [Rugosimonospora africana]GIH20936.1 3-ketoacyl-ACP reductase [Rugosimonospora africana]
MSDPMGGDALRGRVALITGAGRGFGRAIAELFVDNGADVVLHYRTSAEGCAEVVERAGKRGVRAVVLQADLAEPAAARELAARAREELGPVDVLVNNAGVMRVGSFLGSTEEDWDAELDLNVRAALRVTRSVVPMMIERNYGKIINLSSQLALRGWGRGAVYAGTKGFLLTWTKSLAVELGRYRINVNALGPGSILTDMNREIFPDEQTIQRKAQELPLRRMGHPSDVAECALFLASPASDFMTGQMLGINGGSQM